MIYSLVSSIGCIFSNKFTRYVSRVFSLLCSYLYSGWVMKQLYKRGKNIIFNYPATLTGLGHVTIGNNFYARKGLRIDAISEFQGSKFSPQIIIGNNVHIEENCHVCCIHKVSIGDNVLIAGRVFITDHFHGSIDADSLKHPPFCRPLFSKGDVVIGKNVWIGENATIVPNVSIGDNSIIGANSVVTKSFPANSVIAGNPAIIIKTL